MHVVSLARACIVEPDDWLPRQRLHHMLRYAEDETVACHALEALHAALDACRPDCRVDCRMYRVAAILAPLIKARHVAPMAVLSEVAPRTDELPYTRLGWFAEEALPPPRVDALVRVARYNVRGFANMLNQFSDAYGPEDRLVLMRALLAQLQRMPYELPARRLQLLLPSLATHNNNNNKEPLHIEVGAALESAVDAFGWIPTSHTHTATLRLLLQMYRDEVAQAHAHRRDQLAPILSRLAQRYGLPPELLPAQLPRWLPRFNDAALVSRARTLLQT